MSDLGANKIFGAVLATGLAILGLREASSIMFHVSPPEQPGWAVEIVEEVAGGAEVVLPPDWGTVLPVADIAAGEVAFAKCLSCHLVTPGASTLTGPNLHGIVGRQPAVLGDFDYSPVMRDFINEAPTWDYQHLYDFIAAPQRYMRGTKMTFVGIRRQDELVNLIAYLRAHTPNPPPIPEPMPVEVAEADDDAAEDEAPAAETAEADAPAADPAA